VSLAPHFLVLLYKLDPETSKRFVLVNDSPFPLSPNLFQALTHLKSSKIKLPIWLDAICVNQADIEERQGHLVGMNRIYKSAAKVVFWLGEGDNSTANLPKLLDTIIKNGVEAGIALAAECVHETGTMELSGGGMRKLFQPLIDLCIPPWLSRVSIPPKRLVPLAFVFMCGHQMIAVDQAMMGCLICAIWYINAHQQDAKEQIVLQQVYLEFARALIGLGHLDILTLCRSRYSNEYQHFYDRDPKLPTWVPDWNVPMCRPWGGMAHDRLFLWAPGNLKQTISAADEGKVLTIQARFVGYLAEFGSRYNHHGSSDQSANFTDEIRLFREINKFLLQSKCYTHESKLEAAWRIPIADQEIRESGHYQRATVTSYQQYRDFRKFIMDGSILNIEEEFTPYVERMREIQDCRPFISVQGLVGICPGAAKRGDEIYIVPGIHVPIVLRRNMEEMSTNVVVGEAYVFGLMDVGWYTKKTMDLSRPAPLLKKLL